MEDVQPTTTMSTVAEKLATVRRGAKAAVKAKGHYRIGGKYNMDTIYKYCARIDNKRDDMKVSWMLNPTTAAKHELAYIPRTTLRRWLEDDAVVMAKKGLKGCAGVPHWRAEKEIRRRRGLPKLGAPSQLTDAQQKAIMQRVDLSDQEGAQRSKPEIREIIANVLHASGKVISRGRDQGQERFF